MRGPTCLVLKWERPWICYCHRVLSQCLVTGVSPPSELLATAHGHLGRGPTLPALDLFSYSAQPGRGAERAGAAWSQGGDGFCR